MTTLLKSTALIIAVVSLCAATSDRNTIYQSPVSSNPILPQKGEPAIVQPQEEPLLEEVLQRIDKGGKRDESSYRRHHHDKQAKLRSKRQTSRRQTNVPKPMSMPGLIIAHGYPAEVHHVTTEDGYILEMHRIPGPRILDMSPKKKRLARSRSRTRGKRNANPEEDCIPLPLSVEGAAKGKSSHPNDLNNSINLNFNHNSTTSDIVNSQRRPRFKRQGRRVFRRKNRIQRQRQLIRTMDPRVILERSRIRRRMNRRLKLSAIDTNLQRQREASKRSIDGGGENNSFNLFRVGTTLGSVNSNNCVEQGVNKCAGKDRKTEAKPKRFCSVNTKNTSKNVKNKHLNGKKKKVVFIQHCLQCSSADYCVNDHNQALGFVLADAGYDVWLGNFRGNQYSKRHKFLSPNNVNYWKFTVDDLAQYDLPAMVNYVREVTETDKVDYIGHSLGTMTFFMATSSSPSFKSRINMMVALAPAGNLDHMRGGLRFMLKTSQNFYRLLEAFGIGEIGGVLPTRGGFVREACKPSSPLVSVCSSFLPAVSGRNNGLHDEEYLPMMLSNFPAGTSLRLMAQIGQIIGSGGLRKFDYGSAASNRQRYGTAKPPYYVLENISTPVAIMWAENDYIVTPEDVALTALRLPNVILNYRVPHDTFNHVDFLFADVARQLVYEPILELLDMY